MHPIFNVLFLVDSFIFLFLKKEKFTVEQEELQNCLESCSKPRHINGDTFLRCQPTKILGSLKFMGKVDTCFSNES